MSSVNLSLIMIPTMVFFVMMMMLNYVNDDYDDDNDYANNDGTDEIRIY